MPFPERSLPFVATKRVALFKTGIIEIEENKPVKAIEDNLAAWDVHIFLDFWNASHVSTIVSGWDSSSQHNRV